MKEFIFLYKSGNAQWMTHATADEKSALLAQWRAWLGMLAEKGHLVTGGSPLAYDGKRVAQDGVITDIAASEVKELVSGYSIVKAANYDDAVKLTRGCPILERPGTSIEVRCVGSM